MKGFKEKDENIPIFEYNIKLILRNIWFMPYMIPIYFLGYKQVEYLM